MGGTKILSAAINSSEGMIARVKQSTNRKASNSEHLHSLSSIVRETISEAKLKNEQIAAVCLGIPGSLNPHTGVVAMAPNLHIKNLKIKELLEAELNLPVIIENDVNMSALGISKFGVGKNAKDLLVVYIGTGIGAGFIFDGKLFRGANYAAGEIGHIQVQENGPLCGCGKRGCYEAVASRTAIVNNILDDINSGKKSILTKIVEKGKPVKSRALSEAVKKEDKVVKKRLDEACAVTGLVLSNITNLLNLDLIVLGGGLVEALDYYMIPRIREAFKKNVLKESAKGLRIRPTKLGEKAALYGSIPLVEEYLGIKV